jgi:uncharacterized protein
MAGYVGSWLVGADDERLEVRVIPRARRNEVSADRSGRLVVRVVGAPVDDQANVGVRKLVADHLGVRVSTVDIVTGHHSRNKVLRIHRH